MNKLEKFIERLYNIGIQIKLIGNYPWIYIEKINGKVVKEKFMAEHGFTIGFQPTQLGKEFEFTDLKEIFKLIRKYK